MHSVFFIMNNVYKCKQLVLYGCAKSANYLVQRMRNVVFRYACRMVYIVCVDVFHSDYISRFFQITSFSINRNIRKQYSHPDICKFVLM